MSNTVIVLLVALIFRAVMGKTISSAIGNEGPFGFTMVSAITVDLFRVAFALFRLNSRGIR